MFKKYRKLRNFTQEELAELINITPRQLQRLENGESEPKISTFRRLVRVLKIEDKDIILFIKKGA